MSQDSIVKAWREVFVIGFNDKSEKIELEFNGYTYRNFYTEFELWKDDPCGMYDDVIKIDTSKVQNYQWCFFEFRVTKEELELLKKYPKLYIKRDIPSTKFFKVHYFQAYNRIDGRYDTGGYTIRGYGEYYPNLEL